MPVRHAGRCCCICCPLPACCTTLRCSTRPPPPPPGVPWSPWPRASGHQGAESHGAERRGARALPARSRNPAELQVGGPAGVCVVVMALGLRWQQGEWSPMLLWLAASSRLAPHGMPDQQPARATRPPCRSQHLVSFMGAYVSANEVAVVTELCLGGTLYSALAERRVTWHNGCGRARQRCGVGAGGRLVMGLRGRAGGRRRCRARLALALRGTATAACKLLASPRLGCSCGPARPARPSPFPPPPAPRPAQRRAHRAAGGAGPALPAPQPHPAPGPQVAGGGSCWLCCWLCCWRAFVASGSQRVCFLVPAA